MICDRIEKELIRRVEGEDMKVGVLGATGYAGQELVRLLKRHELSLIHI